jgi:hypothetical protein
MNHTGDKHRVAYCLLNAGLTNLCAKLQARGRRCSPCLLYTSGRSCCSCCRAAFFTACMTPVVRGAPSCPAQRATGLWHTRQHGRQGVSSIAAGTHCVALADTASRCMSSVWWSPNAPGDAAGTAAATHTTELTTPSDLALLPYLGSRSERFVAGLLMGGSTCGCVGA